MIHDDIKEIMIPEDEIHKIVKSLGEQINRDYEGKEILFVVILKGSLVFAADLMREIHVPLKLDFMQASSYGSGTKSSGFINIKKDLDNDAAGKDILIVEDIVCTLLSKPSRREMDVEVEYIGRDIPDEFVVGYGLDFNERYRHLPYVGILKPKVYAKL